MKNLKSFLVLLGPTVAFLFFALEGKADSKDFKVSSEFFEGKRLSPGEFVLDLEKTKQQFKSRKEVFCSSTKLPSDQQKSLEILSKTNQHLCESKRKGKNILEFCTCVTLNSFKKIGGYAPLQKNEMESYKIILEDLAITQSIKQKFNGLIGIALSVQNASTHAPIWKVINRASEDQLVNECSPEYIGDFMQNADCEEKGLARMNKVLSPLGLDIFPDSDKKNGGTKFGEILSQKLEQRLGLPSLRSCIKIGEESIANNSERKEIEEGNALFLKALNKGSGLANFSVDDFQQVCAFLKHDPFISQRIFSELRNKSLASGQQDLVKKRSMNCSLNEEAKEITKEWFDVVFSDFKKQKKSLFKDKKGDLSPSEFQSILDAHYRESSKEMLSQCRSLKKEILNVCKISQKNSFSPAELGFIPGPTSILKASQDVIHKYKKDLPPPPASDERIKSQMDQLMCFMHGDANGLVSSDALSYAQEVATFTKHEDLESTTGKEDNGSLYEESDEGVKIDQWIAKADNDSRLGLKNDYEKHPDLYPKKEEGSETKASSSPPAIEPTKENGHVSKKDPSGGRSLDDSPSSLIPGPAGERSFPSATAASSVTAPESSKSRSYEPESSSTAAPDKASAGSKVRAASGISELPQKDKSKLPSNESQSSKLSAAEELDKAMAKYDQKREEAALNKKEKSTSSGASQSAVSTFPIAPKVPNYSASSFEGNGNGGAFNILPQKKGGVVSKYASFKDESGHEIVVDLASSDILILSENQFAQMSEEDFKEWYEKSKGEAIYIMDPSGAIKRAIPTMFGKTIKYMCLNDKEGKLTPIECQKEQVAKVEQVAMTSVRPKSSSQNKSKAPVSHKALVELLQKQTAKRVQTPLAPKVEGP